MAKAEECEKIRGALVAFRASLIVALAVWLRSISMPSLFISRTTVLPNAVRPPPAKESKRSGLIKNKVRAPEEKEKGYERERKGKEKKRKKGESIS